jgi:hypothetical protein
MTIELEGNSDLNTSVRIYNKLGKVMLQQNFSGQAHTLDLESLPEGMYLLRLADRNGNVFHKVIKD